MLGAVSRRPKDGHGPHKGAGPQAGHGPVRKLTRCSHEIEIAVFIFLILTAPKSHYSKADKEDLCLSTPPHFSAFLQISKERVKPKSKSGEEDGARNFQPYLLRLSAPYRTCKRCNLTF